MRTSAGEREKGVAGTVILIAGDSAGEEALSDSNACCEVFSVWAASPGDPSREISGSGAASWEASGSTSLSIEGEGEGVAWDTGAGPPQAPVKRDRARQPVNSKIFIVIFTDLSSRM